MHGASKIMFGCIRIMSGCSEHVYRDIHNHSHGTGRTGSVRLEGLSLPLTVVFSTAVRFNGRVRALLSLREQCPGQGQALVGKWGNLGAATGLPMDQLGHITRYVSQPLIAHNIWPLFAYLPLTLKSENN
jgi:hypothetical protein